MRPNNNTPRRGTNKERQRETRQAHEAVAETDAYFTVPDLMKRWRLSERHVRRILASGALTLTRFGKAVRVAVAEALRYEADCSESPLVTFGQDITDK